MGQLAEPDSAGWDRRDRIRERPLERLPIRGTHRAFELLGKVDLPVQGLVVNRVSPTDADGDVLARRREQERVGLAEIERRFGGVPRVYLPMLPRDITDRDALEALTRVLSGPGVGVDASAADA